MDNSYKIINIQMYERRRGSGAREGTSIWIKVSLEKQNICRCCFVFMLLLVLSQRYTSQFLNSSRIERFYERTFRFDIEWNTGTIFCLVFLWEKVWSEYWNLDMVIVDWYKNNFDNKDKEDLLQWYRKSKPSCYPFYTWDSMAKENT